MCSVCDQSCVDGAIKTFLKLLSSFCPTQRPTSAAGMATSIVVLPLRASATKRVHRGFVPPCMDRMPNTRTAFRRTFE